MLQFPPMPILSSAKKALRQEKRRTLINKIIKTKAKTAIDAQRRQPAAESLSQAFSAIDKAVKKNVFHKNKGARLKSRLSKLLVKSNS